MEVDVRGGSEARDHGDTTDSPKVISEEISVISTVINNETDDVDPEAPVVGKSIESSLETGKEISITEVEEMDVLIHERVVVADIHDEREKLIDETGRKSLMKLNLSLRDLLLGSEHSKIT